MYRKLLPLLLLFVSVTAFAQVPTISSFSPVSGAAGSAVTIIGNNLGATAAKNIVWIGGAKATVLSASSTKLTVTVPQGATYGAISVATGGLTAYSLNSFVVTYPDGGSMYETPGGFAPKSDMKLGNSEVVADKLVSADFDGDGKPDIATLEGSLGLYIFKNLGDRTIPFGSIPSLKLNQTGVGFAANNGLIAVGDFNGDGKPDIITSYYGSGGNLAVFINTSTPGNLSFAAPVALTTGSSPTAVVVGDFNGDGKLDIATSNNGTTPTFSVVLNTGSNGNVSFATKQDFTVGGDPTSIAVGDFDGDGKLDLVTANHTGNTISVVRNTTANGVLSFAPKVDYQVGSSPITVLTADLDGDGKTDIITTNHLDFGEVHTGNIYRNISTSGNIAFSAATSYNTGVYSQSATIADIDGDGKPDLILADKTSNTATVIGNGSVPGTISMGGGPTLSGIRYPGGVVAGDFTGDGKADVVVLSGNGGNSFISTFVNVVNPASPVITSLSSMTAAEGATITITGTHFTGATSVRFGGTQATSFTVVSPTTITAVVPKAASGYVDVTTPVNNAEIYGFVFINKPAVSTVTVAASGSNYLVTINGLYLANTSAVTFDGVAAASFTNVSANQITAVTNTNTFSAINITTPGGSTVFNYGPLPKITKLSTATATQGTSITITGSNFTNVTSVSLGGTPAASFQVVSPTSITAVYGQGNTGEITVTTLYGRAVSTGASPGFVNFSGPPIITSLSQTSATQGTGISIHGMNFPVTATVTFGGVPATSVNVGDWSGLTATVGNGASGDVVVTTPQGSATYPGFTFLQPTVLKSFSGNTSRGSAVTLTGTGLDKVTGITFGGVPAQSFTINSSTQITAILGLGYTGLIVATYPSGTTSLGGFGYTLSTPVITSFSPTNAGSQQIVNIKGIDFLGATAVTFGGVPAVSFVVDSINSITAMVDKAVSGNVTVTTPKGTATLGGFGNTTAPVINSFAPLAAQQGATVTIAGTNFTGTKSVSFGTVAATSFTVNSATSITAVVGAGKSGSVKVVTPNGAATLPGFKFGVLPTITSFSPATAKTGNSVAIKGSNFTGATAVSFGGINAKSFTVNADNSITAVVGAGRSGAIKVTTPTGSSSMAGFTYEPPPIVRGFTPTSATSGDVVTIRGAYFTGATQVTFGGVRARSFTVDSASRITATVAGGASGAVKVITPDGSSTLDGFTYTTSPVMTSFAPTTGKAGSVIIITGKNFTGATAVTFGDVKAASFVVNSDTKITATVGSGRSGSVMVVTPTGAASRLGFTFKLAPSITSISPTTAGTGSTVTITGTNFTNITSVTFGGIPAKSIYIHSPTNITATVGTGASGNVKVTSSEGVGSIDGFVYKTTPFITSFSPMDGKIYSKVTIKGVNFTGATAVTIGGYNVFSFTVNSATSITAEVGFGGSGNVVVKTPSGTASLAGFAYHEAPFIENFTPSAGMAGTVVTITGIAFTGATVVSFGGVAAQSFTVNSSTKITATVGEGRGGLIRVTTPYGTDTISGFIYKPIPTITSFTPTEAKTGDVVTITGTNFHYATGVSFGGVPATEVDVFSDTRLTAKVGGGASGKVAIISPFGDGTKAGFTYDAPKGSNSIPTPDGQSAATDSAALSMFYTLSSDKKHINLSLNGSHVYHIQLNGTLYYTTDNITTLPLTFGKNELTITTDKSYQGAIKRVIIAKDDITPYPDPFEGTLFLNLGSHKAASASVVVYSNMGVILYRHQFSNPLNIIRLDMPEVKTKGIYTLRLTLDGVPSVYKVIRK